MSAADNPTGVPEAKGREAMGPEEVRAQVDPADAQKKENGSAPLLFGIRLTRMVWRMLGALALAANLVLWAWLLGASESIQDQARVCALYIAAYSFLVALAQEILSPRNAELRLLPIPDYRAARLFAILRGVFFIVLGTHLAIYLVRANEWSEAVAALLSVTEQVGLIVFGWGALRRSGLLEKFTPDEPTGYLGLLVRLTIKVILPLAVLTLLFYIIGTAMGLCALSRWVVQRAALSSAFILFLGLIFRGLRRQLHKTVNFMRDAHVAEAEEGEVGTPWYLGVERILASTLQILVAVVLAKGLFSIWSLEWSDFESVLEKPALIGQQSWGELLHGLGLALLAWMAHGFVRNLLIFIVFPKADVEAGARYAMLTVLRYVAWVVVGILLMTAVGADTSTLAVLAGGASVGLGFAMKDIFSNFFGGLIMLLERPVRVGDTIEVGGVKGKVEAIRLRGTLLRTFDGTTVMIPNTTMISTNLANLTHGFQTARMQVEVGVSYDENPAIVEQILLKVAHSDPRVLDEPSPAVRFNSFGASSLDFSLRVWTRVLGERWAMVSEMRHKIFNAFKEAGIEIPFNQMDLHMKGDQTFGAGEPKAEVAPDPAAETPKKKTGQ